MSKIITVTLNPAIDKSTSIDQLLPEKKIRCGEPIFQPGGGGINVSRALKKLQNSSNCVYFSGGYSGDFFSALLQQESIQIHPIKSKGITRENFVVFDQSNQLQYRFGMPGIIVDEEECMMLLHEIEQMENVDYMVVSGSMPIGAPPDLCSTLSKIAKQKSAKFIIDTSGESLSAGLKSGAFLIKPNLSELQSLCKQASIRYEDIPTIGKKMMEENHIENMIVSLGKEGAILITQNETLHLTPPQVNTVSTVGAGDSMVAGIIHGLSQQWSLIDCAKYGVACGTATTLQPGTALFNTIDIKLLLPEVSVKMIN